MDLELGQVCVNFSPDKASFSELAQATKKTMDQPAFPNQTPSHETSPFRALDVGGVEQPQPVQNAKELQYLREQNEVLADVVVNSAQIIEELEQTKRQLATAQAATEQAHLSSQRMAATIFEGTQDGMIVMNHNQELISANQNARNIFGLGSIQPGASLTKLLTTKYRAGRNHDWLSALADSPDSRIELFEWNEHVVEDRQAKSATSLLQKRWIEASMCCLNQQGGCDQFLLTARDITQRKSIEDQFQHQALHDNVTQLPNRRYFVRQIESVLATAKPETQFSVCFLDLDNFKTVNDTLGHEAGDQLLVQVAKRIEETTRNDCFLARFGGDEFAVMIPNLPANVVTKISNRIVSEVQRPFTIGDNSVFIGVSIGMTRYPDDATDANALLQNADVAMYSAKEGGRNCVHPFTQELADGLLERKTLVEDLRESLETQDVELEYQPKWCLRSNKLSGCEALLRWKRNGKLVSPARLIEAAECSGLILPLGDIVLEIAIEQLAQWQRNNLFAGKMAINLSPRQLIDPNFIGRFTKIVSKAGVSPTLIELEITETAMMENLDVAFQKIKELRDFGVSIAIDDFGTGYSSLSYLKSLPISTLKIDGSFVKDLPDDRKGLAVAKAVLSLGHGLGLEVVAEGVETIAQYQFLRQAGCDQAQGYLLSKSLNQQNFQDWSRRATLETDSAEFDWQK